jgi:sulfate transport system permease protein
VVLPTVAPALLTGFALAFARAIGEFGSLVLLTGNIPFKTQAASVYIFGRVQTNDLSGAAAVSVFLLAIAVGLLFALNLFATWRSRHERA